MYTEAQYKSAVAPPPGRRRSRRSSPSTTRRLSSTEVVAWPGGVGALSQSPSPSAASASATAAPSPSRRSWSSGAQPWRRLHSKYERYMLHYTAPKGRIGDTAMETMHPPPVYLEDCRQERCDGCESSVLGIHGRPASLQTLYVDAAHVPIATVREECGPTEGAHGGGYQECSREGYVLLPVCPPPSRSDWGGPPHQPALQRSTALRVAQCRAGMGGWQPSSGCCWLCHTFLTHEEEGGDGQQGEKECASATRGPQRPFSPSRRAGKAPQGWWPARSFQNHTSESDTRCWDRDDIEAIRHQWDLLSRFRLCGRCHQLLLRRLATTPGAGDAFQADRRQCFAPLMEILEGLQPPPQQQRGCCSIAFLYFLRLYVLLRERVTEGLRDLSPTTERWMWLDEGVSSSVQLLQRCLALDAREATRHSYQNVNTLAGVPASSVLHPSERFQLLTEWRHIEQAYLRSRFPHPQNDGIR